MGIVFAVFHIIGMMFVLSDMLYMCVSRVIAVGPRCFRCLMFVLSGPVELLLFECFMACFVCSSVMSKCSVESSFVFRSIFLFVSCVRCFMVLVNCLLNCSAFCLLFVVVLLLKVIFFFFFSFFAPNLLPKGWGFGRWAGKGWKVQRKRKTRELFRYEARSVPQVQWGEGGGVGGT